MDRTTPARDLRVNIGSQQRKVRGLLGIILLAASVAITVQVIEDSVTVLSGFLLFLLLQNGIMLVMEWRMGVCPVNAIRGRQSMTGWFSIGKEVVEEEEKVKAARRAAVKQFAWSVFLAVIFTGLVVLVQ